MQRIVLDMGTLPVTRGVREILATVEILTEQGGAHKAIPHRHDDPAGLIASEALTLPNEARTVCVRDGKLSATDGPFIETKEVIAGFSVIEVADYAEAEAIAAGCPMLEGGGSVEIRPVLRFRE